MSIADGSSGLVFQGVQGEQTERKHMKAISCCLIILSLSFATASAANGERKVHNAQYYSP